MYCVLCAGLPQHVKSASVPVNMTRHNTLPSTSSVNLTARLSGPPALRPNTPTLPPKPFKSNIMFQFNTNET